MPAIKLLIFDLDGTLIDSLPDLTDAANRMREHFGLSPFAIPDVRRLVGQGARSLVERALPGASEGQVEEGLQIFLDYNLAHIADKTRSYPGVAETLKALHDRGFAMALLSNKNVALCREVLEKLGLDRFFPTVLGADSLPFRKPSPEPVLALVKKFELDPRECAMIGDSINDMAAGEGAGVITIGCRYGYGEASELAGADFQVEDLPSLLALPVLN
ncbi:HAD-IIIA family hydrolase [Geomonas sp. Red32]|uniref:HAD family hydrolase n=1 Tax=Geomonas sp. Red32 TaxID=2912856 RepID=UPI00202CCFD8|nr:HAD-IIIA family hydrolase [Geomonas sp. Red32]MCM0082974.1 HAD-IIIA family hydrolase [Geomonas sp. Red32]